MLDWQTASLSCLHHLEPKIREPGIVSQGNLRINVPARLFTRRSVYPEAMSRVGYDFATVCVGVIKVWGEAKKKSGVDRTYAWLKNAVQLLTQQAVALVCGQFFELLWSVVTKH